MKNRDGITLVALSVTIIVMLIIAGIGTYGGITMIQNSADKKLQTELEMVQHAILEQYVKYQTIKDSRLLIGTAVTVETASGIASQMGVHLKASSGYYELEPSQMETIGIQYAQDTYIVNYETGEVMNKTQIKTNSGDALYVTGVTK